MQTVRFYSGVQRPRIAEVPEIEFLQLGRGVNFSIRRITKVQ
jgi:hypothetical protein